MAAAPGEAPKTVMERAADERVAALHKANAEGLQIAHRLVATDLAAVGAEAALQRATADRLAAERAASVGRLEVEKEAMKRLAEKRAHADRRVQAAERLLLRAQKAEQDAKREAAGATLERASMDRAVAARAAAHERAALAAMDDEAYGGPRAGKISIGVEKEVARRMAASRERAGVAAAVERAAAQRSAVLEREATAGRAELRRAYDAVTNADAAAAEKLAIRQRTHQAAGAAAAVSCTTPSTRRGTRGWSSGGSNDGSNRDSGSTRARGALRATPTTPPRLSCTEHAFGSRAYKPTRDVFAECREAEDGPGAIRSRPSHWFA